MTVGSNCIRSGSLKHICAAGPGSGMNKFNIKKLRSEGRAAQTVANAKQTKNCARQIPLEACVWFWLRSEIWWIPSFTSGCANYLFCKLSSANRSFQIRHTQKRVGLQSYTYPPKAVTFELLTGLPMLQLFTLFQAIKSSLFFFSGRKKKDRFLTKLFERADNPF